MAKYSLLRLVKIAIGAEKESGLSGRLEHFVHFWFFVGRSFVQNRCLIRASALSYTTLLAMIPLLAIAISVTSSLLKKEGEQDIYKAIDKFISQVMPPATVSAAEVSYHADLAAPTNSEVSATNAAVTSGEAVKARVAVQSVVADHIHQFIHNTRSGALGITGVALLIFVAISMLDSIEGTFNDIWGVERGRSWLMRMGRFWIAISLGPLLIAAAVGLLGGSHFQATSELVRQTPVVGRLAIQIVTLAFIWLVFAFFYQLVPNTKVQFSAALAGGVMAGTLWHLNNLFGFLYVSRVVSNSKIFGGLGLIPVFMAGVYFSWAILLLGAQVAYAFQNRKIYLQEKAIEGATQRDLEIVALRLMTRIGRYFQTGEKPLTVQQAGVALGIPTRLVQQVIQTLLDARLVTEIAGHAGYVPARALDAINVHDILYAMRVGTTQSLVLPITCASQEVVGEFEKIEEAERAAAAPVTLQALVQKTEPK
jgi:membrane protein